MSPTVRALRIALPIAFVAFVILIAVNFTSIHRNNKPPIPPPTSTILPDQKIKMLNKRFEDIQTIAGKIALKITADEQISFDSGWHTLEGVKLTIYRENGLSYEISTPRAKVNAETREAVAEGGVRVASSDGIELQSDSIHFDGKHVTNEHVPVRFKVDEWQGTAGGLNLSVDEETLSLTSGVTAALQPKAAGEPRVDIRSADAIFHQKTSDVTFGGGVDVVRQRDTIHSQSVVARFDDKAKRLTALEGVGSVVAQLAENSSIAAPGAAQSAGRTTINADRFFTEIGPDGGVHAIHVLGEQSIARAELQGPPRRTISAREFRVVVPNGNLNEVHAEKEVTLTEEGVAPRIVTANIVTLFFDVATRKPSNAVLEQNVNYRDGKINATSQRAVYDLVSRKLVLSATPANAPQLKSATETLRANSIEVSGVSETLDAVGNVYAELAPRAKGAASASETGLFPDKTPVYINADSATMHKSDRSAIFRGNVRAWQGTNTIFAAELQTTGGGETVVATGGVRAAVTNTKPGVTRPTPLLASAKQMISHKTDRRIDLEGSVKVDDEGRTMTSDRAAMFLDAKQKFERLEANGNVQLVERAANRKGSSDKAIYRVQQKTVVMTGNPASITDPRGTIKGTQILLEIDKNKVSVISGSTPTEATYNPQ